MNKTAPYILFFVVLFGGLLIWNRQRQARGNVLSSSSSSTGVVTTQESNYDFGTIPMYEGDVEHLYALKNSGTEPVTLGELYTSCMCTTAQVEFTDGTKSKIGGMRGHDAPTFINHEIAPGEQFQVKVVFDPAAHGPQGVGAVSRTVYLQTNSKQTPVVELDFQAMVVR